MMFRYRGEQWQFNIVQTDLCRSGVDYRRQPSAGISLQGTLYDKGASVVATAIT